MNQEMRDWRDHPITTNFIEAVKEAIDHYRESLSNLDVDFKDKEVARKIGVIQGLEALLTYEPEFDENGDIVKDA